MSHSTYKCTHCGVMANSKCVRQRSIYMDPTGALDSNELSTMCEMSQLLHVKVEFAVPTDPSDTRWTATVSTTQYIDRSNTDRLENERRVLKTLIRRLTWALRTDENIGLCELLGQHEWVFLHGEQGQDTCMFGCCHAE